MSPGVRYYYTVLLYLCLFSYISNFLKTSTGTNIFAIVLSVVTNRTLVVGND